MAEFQNKKTMYKFLRSPLAIIVLLLLSGAVVWGAIDIFQKERETNMKKKTVAENIAELKAREDLLEKQIQDLKTDYGVEKNLRENFGLAKDGEGVIVIPEETPPQD